VAVCVGLDDGIDRARRDLLAQPNEIRRHRVEVDDRADRGAAPREARCAAAGLAD
jgi:hypothetical protein